MILLEKNWNWHKLNSQNESSVDYSSKTGLNSLYSYPPEDIEKFRKVNTYLDPNIALRKDKITFLRIVESNSSSQKIKDKFNKYLNVKYNHISHPLSYKENMNKFVRQSKIVSDFLDDVLKVGKFSKEEVEVLKENQILKENPNIFELLNIYRNAKNRRLKFEILRKIGLVDLVSRIEKNFPFEYTEFVTNEVEKLFSIGLSLKKQDIKSCYIWMDELNKVKYSFKESDACILYQEDNAKRKNLNLGNSPFGKKLYSPFKISNDSHIEVIEIRDKLRRNNKHYYTSFLEKMIRKNIEFPTQIHDTIGVRLVVKNQDEIHNCISNIEKFIGGSSSRKKEKNTMHKFGLQKLSSYSSEDYYVWKAVYDIALPHFTIKYLKEIEKMTKEQNVKKTILKRIESLIKNPINAVVEVQVQDFESYALSILEGSPTDHSRLKMNQIRRNSFHKLYPKEIYEKELKSLY